VRTDLPLPLLAEIVTGALVHVDRWLVEDSEPALGTILPAIADVARNALEHSTRRRSCGPRRASASGIQRCPSIGCSMTHAHPGATKSITTCSAAAGSSTR
jgi:hypothetical protein